MLRLFPDWNNHVNICLSRTVDQKIDIYYNNYYYKVSLVFHMEGITSPNCLFSTLFHWKKKTKMKVFWYALSAKSRLCQVFHINCQIQIYIRFTFFCFYRLCLDSWVSQLCCLLQTWAPCWWEEQKSSEVDAAALFPISDLLWCQRAPVCIHSYSPHPVVQESALSNESIQSYEVVRIRVPPPP